MQTRHKGLKKLPSAKVQRSIVAGLISSKESMPRRAGLGLRSGKEGFYQVRSTADRDVLVATHRNLRDLDYLVHVVHNAKTMDLIELQRTGVNCSLVKDIANTMRIPTKELYVMIGVPRATAEKKASENKPLEGSGGYSAIGIAKLLGMARSMAEKSTHPDAKRFNADQWLGEWIQTPQPALEGKKPSEFLDTPIGVELVGKVLGAIESGAYL